MNNFLAIATKRTPEIIFISTGILIIKGSSKPEDATKFYQPAFVWLEKFKQNITTEVSLTLDLDYMNTTSSRVFLDMIKFVKALASKKVKVKIAWKYEHDDHDMLEQGKMYETLVEFPFEFVEKKS